MARSVFLDLVRTLELLLPALVPSWRFFAAVAPSPRIEYALLATPTAEPAAWSAFRPRPASIKLRHMLARLLWNPRWNEGLFLVTCAERIIAEQSAHAADEIARRIAADLDRDLDHGPAGKSGARFFRFRLVFVMRDGMILERHVAFLSAAHGLATHDRANHDRANHDRAAAVP